MRIAHIITRLILGGAQENVVLCCEDLLRDYGDNVLLITGPALGPEGSLLDRARAGGVPLAIIPSLRRAIHLWRDLVAYREIGRVLREFHPDVVHTHSAKGGILGRAAAWRIGVPAIVHTVHGAPFHPYQSLWARSLFRGCEQWAAKRCHSLVSVADAMTDLLVSAGVAPREKFTTIYSGIEIEPLLESHRLRDAVRCKLGYRPEHVVIGKIARLFHLKGHKYLIEAARRLVRAEPLVQFLLVGDGLLRNQLEQEIRAAGLEKHFQLLGLAPPENIPGLVAAMDIVVHTSLREGLARALVHGLLAGKPVVSFDIDGAREVVLDDITGYLVPPQDCGALAAALHRLTADCALRTRLGAQGRARCEKPFCHYRTTSDIRALYERLLSIAK
ncbi:MAG: glycosyltransferase family 4 protein [Thermoguttaceae bacterium]